MPGKWFWATSALLFFLLALGPVLQIGGRQVRSIFNGAISLVMPYTLIEHVPPLNVSRSPDRFTMPLTLCLGVLAGYGTNALAAGIFRGPAIGRSGADPSSVDPIQEGASGRAHSNLALIACTSVALIALELTPFPYPQMSAEVPRWYREVAGESGEFTMFELPPQNDYWHGAFRMYYLTTHERPIFGGYISREFPHPFVSSTPGYMDLATSSPDGDMITTGRAEWLSALKQYKTRYVVLQKDRLPDVQEVPADVEDWRTSVMRVLGERKAIYEDEQLAAFLVPLPDEEVPFLSIGAGWEPSEVGPNGPFRWMRDVATIGVHSPQPRHATLHFRATTVGKPRRMVLRYGDKVILDEPVGPLRDYTISLGLTQGISEIQVSNPEGTVKPRNLGMGDDPRDLGFAMLDVRLVR
jgi:hypothetical protein